jgi:hypothetical protein
VQDGLLATGLDGGDLGGEAREDEALVLPRTGVVERPGGMTGKPKLRWYCRQSWVAAALLVPYGEMGRIGSSSRQGRSARAAAPYSSADPTTSRRGSGAPSSAMRRKASRTSSVPSRLALTVPAGSWKLAPAELWPARW